MAKKFHKTATETKKTAKNQHKMTKNYNKTPRICSNGIPLVFPTLRPIQNTWFLIKNDQKKVKRDQISQKMAKKA